MIGLIATLEITDTCFYECKVVETDIKNGDEEWVLVEYYVHNYPSRTWVNSSYFMQAYHQQRLAQGK